MLGSSERPPRCWETARQSCAGPRLVLYSAAGRATKGEDEDGESGSDLQTGKASLVQWGGSEKGSCKFKGPEDDVKSPKTGF